MTKFISAGVLFFIVFGFGVLQASAEQEGANIVKSADIEEQTEIPRPKDIIHQSDISSGKNSSVKGSENLRRYLEFTVGKDGVRTRCTVRRLTNVLNGSDEKTAKTILTLDAGHMVLDAGSFGPNKRIIITQVMKGEELTEPIVGVVDESSITCER